MLSVSGVCFPGIRARGAGNTFFRRRLGSWHGRRQAFCLSLSLELRREPKTLSVGIPMPAPMSRNIPPPRFTDNLHHLSQNQTCFQGKSPSLNPPPKKLPRDYYQRKASMNTWEKVKNLLVFTWTLVFNRYRNKRETLRADEDHGGAQILWCTREVSERSKVVTDFGGTTAL